MLVNGLQSVSLDIYLRQIRSLSRKQFYARALGMKVAAAQRELPPPPPQQPQQPGLLGQGGGLPMGGHGDT
ncbi:uncharacterized protein HaLaN_22273, partial [Haematococcus lacustris]